jgi:hypothetical protein
MLILRDKLKSFRRRIRAMKIHITLFALALALTLAYPIMVTAPVSAEIEQGSQIEIGNVGPGQTFYVIADPNVYTGGKFGTGGAYDKMVVSRLPYGWVSTPSKLYAKALQADVTVPKDAKDGQYEVEFTLWDEAGDYGLGGNVSFTALVTVTRDVMEMKVEPTALSVGADQPARYTITINNKGSANDVFEVGSSGVRDWEFRRSLYIPAGTSKTITYEVVGKEEADYAVKIWAKSSSSQYIYSETPVSLRVNTDLFADLRSTTRGLLLFPLPEAPVYYVLGLISNILPS